MTQCRTVLSTNYFAKYCYWVQCYTSPLTRCYYGAPCSLCPERHASGDSTSSLRSSLCSHSPTRIIPSHLPHSPARSELVPTPKYEYMDDGAHWYRASAVLLRFHRYMFIIVCQYFYIFSQSLSHIVQHNFCVGLWECSSKFVWSKSLLSAIQNVKDWCFSV